MLVALDKDEERVFITDAVKGEKYYCPICGEEVVPKQGAVMSWQFAHKSKRKCDPWSSEMSEWHIRMQNRFPKEWQEIVVEYNGEKHRADVLCGNIVLEFQHSGITGDELLKRTLFWIRAGYQIAWIFDGSDYEIDEYGEYRRWASPKPTFNMIGPMMNNGKVFLWLYRVGKADGIEYFERIVGRNNDWSILKVNKPIWGFETSYGPKTFVGEESDQPYHYDMPFVPGKIDQNYTPYEKDIGNFILKGLSQIKPIKAGRTEAVLYSRFDQCYFKRYLKDFFRNDHDLYEKYLAIRIAKLIVEKHYFYDVMISGDAKVVNRANNKYDYDKWLKAGSGYEEFNIHEEKTREQIAGMVYDILEYDGSRPNGVFNSRPEHFYMNGKMNKLQSYACFAAGYICDLYMMKERQWLEEEVRGKNLVTICPECGFTNYKKVTKCEHCGHEDNLLYRSKVEHSDKYFLGSLKKVGKYSAAALKQRYFE